MRRGATLGGMEALGASAVGGEGSEEGVLRWGEGEVLWVAHRGEMRALRWGEERTLPPEEGGGGSGGADAAQTSELKGEKSVLRFHFKAKN